MLSVSSLAASAFVPSPLAARPAPVQGSSSIVMETVEDLKVLAGKCNPNVGYFNPLGLGDGYNFWGESEEATIGFLRQAEIKHGRVAMAAFVGVIVQENDIVFPWKQSLDGTTFADIAAAGGPAAQWDALPINAKAQIFFAISFLEFWSEFDLALKAGGQKHYMRGGKPGYFPKFGDLMVHPMPFDLWDPFGFTKGMSAEAKAKSLVAEINNGRLAMIGILGFAAASKGLQVPGLDSVAGIQPYAGEYMAPFTLSDKLAFVPEMLDTFPKFPWF